MASISLYLNNLIYKSRHNILNMLKTRGFNTKEYENYTQDELILLLEKHQQGKFQNALELSPLDIKLTDNNDRTIIVKYRLDEKFKKTELLLKHINDIFETYELNKDTDCVIIMNINRILIKPGTKDDPVQGFVNLCYLRKMFVQNLLKAGYVTVDDKDRTILTDDGKKFLDNQTKNASIKVELAKLKNLEYRKSLERKAKSASKKRKKK